MSSAVSSPSLARGRKKLNLVLLQPRGRPRGRSDGVRLTARLDPELYVRWVAFQASIESWTRHRVAAHQAVLESALTAFMRSHKAWANGLP
jgi:hypothetical protein